MLISAVINTYNEEKNIGRCLESIKDFADEIVVVDMGSTDKTVEIAKKFKAKIFQHKYTGYVEPARNFALRQVYPERSRGAQGDWILLIDADEELTDTLAEELRKICQKNESDHVEIPRKNIIFGKWIKHSRWWPDYNIRFFKKGMVTWDEKIHSVPMTRGKGIELPPEEEYALTHYHYESLGQYLERSNRYTATMAKDLIEEGYSFSPDDLIKRPVNEFLSRYFFGEGYKDGLHGLVLAMLQAFTELIIYLKVWEEKGFKEEKVNFFPKSAERSIRDFYYWLAKTSKFGQKLRYKLKSLI